MKKKVIFFAILTIIIISGGIILISFNNNDNNVVKASSMSNNTNSKSSENNSSDIITIKDNVFVATLDDIYANYKSYDGKTIKYEGLMYWEDDVRVVGRKYYCCGYDAYLVGLECRSDKEMPKADEWVEVNGTIKIHYDDLGYYPYIEVTSIEILEERGQEIVYF